MSARSRPRASGVLAAGISAALSLALASCGTGSTSSAPSSTRASSTPTVAASHNAADVAFSRQMIDHHAGAIEMAALAHTRASSPKVKSLARRIRAAQQPEISVMTSWLRAWGQPLDGGSSTMKSMAASGPAPMGMMTTAQMDQLSAARGKAFDQMFLTLMAAHHRGAIAMSAAELKQGANPQALELATSIRASQSAQVTEMGQLLTAIGD